MPEVLEERAAEATLMEATPHSCEDGREADFEAATRSTSSSKWMLMLLVAKAVLVVKAVAYTVQSLCAPARAEAYMVTVETEASEVT